MIEPAPSPWTPGAPAQTDDAYYHLGIPIPRPRVFRVVRLHAKPGRDVDLMGCAESITRQIRAMHADVPFRSYVARRYDEAGACEVMLVSVWDRPEDMRRVLVNAEVASRPFGIEAYGDAVERWTVDTYEVFFPRPEDDI
jgi:hypothetical protein